jgi:hypothetical protein
MPVLSENISVVKATTADVQSLVRARVNGNGRPGKDHHHRGRPQIYHGHRRSALKADTANILVEGGMSVTEAIERCAISSNSFYALKALRESGDPVLHNAVLAGNVSTLIAGKRVKNTAAAITALRKCSGLELALVRLATGATDDPVTMLLNLNPTQLVTTAMTLGVDWLWDRMIAPVVSTEVSTVTKPNGNGSVA